MNHAKFALEIDMKPNTGEVYRVAFDSANSELKDIVGAFEDLRARKERIEKVVMALKPLLGAEEAAAAAAAMQSASEAADHASLALEEGSYQYQAANGAGSGDPFASRLNSALGHGVGRKFNRQF